MCFKIKNSRLSITIYIALTIYGFITATIEFSIWDKPSYNFRPKEVKVGVSLQTLVLWSLCFTKMGKHQHFLTDQEAGADQYFLNRGQKFLSAISYRSGISYRHILPVRKKAYFPLIAPEGNTLFSGHLSNKSACAMSWKQARPYNNTIQYYFNCFFMNIEKIRYFQKICRLVAVGAGKGHVAIHAMYIRSVYQYSLPDPSTIPVDDILATWSTPILSASSVARVKGNSMNSIRVWNKKKQHKLNNLFLNFLCHYFLKFISGLFIRENKTLVVWDTSYLHVYTHKNAQLVFACWQAWT